MADSLLEPSYPTSRSPYRQHGVEELRQTIARVVNAWPRDVRVPADLQLAIAEAIFTDHAK